MKVIYKAFDGTEFATPLLCQEYENSLGQFTLIGYNGRECKEAENAAIVILHDSNSADAFLDLAHTQDDHSVRGIDSGDTGIFLWEIYSHRYRKMDYTVIEGLQLALNLYKGENK